MGQSVARLVGEDLRVGKRESNAPGKSLNDEDFTSKGCVGTLEPPHYPPSSIES